MKLAALACGLALAGVLAAALVAEVPDPPLIDWEHCELELDCGTVEVPLDYRQSDGPTIEIALIRAPARDEDHRIGSLLVNPGGPGGSGFDFVRDSASFFDGRLRDRFDIVGFDPRGIGRSDAIECGLDPSRLAALDSTPETAEGMDELREALDGVVTACATLGGDLLPLVGTLNAARDLDRIRAALEDEQLTYLGYSYGTMLGAAYAELFPTHVRALVLDGGVDLGLAWQDYSQEQAGAAERALQRFFDDCRATRCPIADDPEGVWDDIQKRLEELRDTGEGDVGPEHLVSAAALALWSGPFAWPDLADVLDAARRGDFDPLVDLANPFLFDDGSYEPALAISCADESQRPGLEEVVAVVRGLEETYPRLGGLFGGGCPQGWPAAVDPLTDVRAAGAAPIVVIGTRFDPATPYEWSVALADALESGVLLTYEGDGHTASLQGHACVDEAVAAYLVDLATPRDGTSCPAE